MHPSDLLPAERLFNRLSEPVLRTYYKIADKMMGPPSQETVNKRLGRAIWNGQQDLALDALAKGADPNTCYKDSPDTPAEPVIIDAAGQGLDRVVAALINAGVNVEVQSSFGVTARGTAHWHMQEISGKLLTAAGAKAPFGGQKNVGASAKEAPTVK